MTLYQVHDADRPTIAGGEATLGEIFDAAETSGTVVDNTNATPKALEEAYDLRIDAIEQATGVRLEHPRSRAMRDDSVSIFRNPFRRVAEMDAIPEHIASFRDDLAKLAADHQDAAEAIGLDRSFEDEARALANQSEQDLDRLSASRPGLGKFGALFAGGAAAMVQDPVQTPLMVLGAGPGAARTVAGRIGAVAVKEALISGGSEAALQPAVQAWRKEVGLESGFGQAAEQVLFSTVFGGAFGAGARAGGEAVQALGDLLKSRSSDVARAANGDIDAIEATLSPVRDSLPADARGALDAIEADRVMVAGRRKGVDPEIHDAMSARAMDDLQADGPSNRLGDGLEAQRRTATSDGSDIVGEGPHGPILDRVAYQGRWKDAVRRLQDLQGGEIPGALFHPEIGEIDVIWGHAGKKGKDGSGLAKLLDKHPEVVDELPGIIGELDVKSRTKNRVKLESDRHYASVRLTWDDQDKAWLLTAFEKRQWREGTTESLPAKGASKSAPALTDQNIGSAVNNVQPVADARGQYSLPLEFAELDRMPELTRETPADLANTQTPRLQQDADLQAEFPLIQIVDQDGRVVAGSVTLADALDGADRGIALADIVNACKVNR